MTQAVLKRLERAEAALADATAEQCGAAELIARARHHAERRPARSAAALARIGRQPGLAGRMARADLRIMRIGASEAPIEDPERELAQMMGELADDPLAFVLWAYEWGLDPSTKVVRLPAPWSMTYACEFGPDAWACAVLDEIRAQVRGHAFDGASAVDAVRVAISSGHGVGKSALTAWVCDWLMSTRPFARGVVTASTSPQLESKTWAQVAAWTKRCITAHWWDVTIGRGSMKMTHLDHREGWRVDALTCARENAEAFAGLHAADSSAFYLVDESSGVPDAIHDVMQGGMTDGEPFLLAMGNPTKNAGWFHGAFHGMRHRWTTYQVDSRSVQVTNKPQLDQWVEDYGLQSDFVKVRVLGVFPSASSLQFIGRDLVDEARRREASEDRDQSLIVAVDVARFGDDQSVIVTRCGRDARTFEPLRFRGLTTMHLAARVAEHVNFLRSAGRRVLIAVDGGGVGGGVVDRLRHIGFEVTEVQFGERAGDPRRYANRRAELWGLMRDWLKVGAIPDDEELATDLCAPEYGFNPRDAILLESKDSMKARGMASPDAADALAISFAVQPAFFEPLDALARRDAQQRAADYRHDPIGASLRRMARPGAHDPFARHNHRR